MCVRDRAVPPGPLTSRAARISEIRLATFPSSTKQSGQRVSRISLFETTAGRRWMRSSSSMKALRVSGNASPSRRSMHLAESNRWLPKLTGDTARPRNFSGFPQDVQPGRPLPSTQSPSLEDKPMSCSLKVRVVLWPSLLLTAAAGCGGPLPEQACSDCEVAVVQRAATVPAIPAIAPSADAFVRDGTSAGSNFGAATTLEVKTTTSAGNNRIAYLRFPISSFAGTVASATLRLHGNRPSNNGVTDSVFAVASTSWSETGITWNNRPALGAAQGTGVAVTTTAQDYSWNVTSYVAAQK